MVGTSSQAGGQTTRAALRKGLLALAVTAGIGIGLRWKGLDEAFSPVGQTDFESYYYAVQVYDAGGNPWDGRELVNAAERWVNSFYYPHHTLVFFRWFASGELTRGKDMFLAANLACLGALCALWTAIFIRAGARGWFLAFIALGYDATICQDLKLGNVSLLEQTLIWFGIFALMRGRAWVFCLLIILAAQFKVLPICLLGLVLLTDSPRKWHCLGGSLAACLLIAVSVYASNPEAARIFVDVAVGVGTTDRGGALNPCSLALIREVTDHVTRYATMFDGVRPVPVAGALYATYALVVLAVFLWAARRGGDLRHSIFLGLVTYALVAPRMKDYSYVLLLVPAFELIRARMSRRDSGRLLVFAVVAMLTLPGLDVVWRYRSLVLTGWVWLIGLRMTGAASGCRIEATADMMQPG